MEPSPIIRFRIDRDIAQRAHRMAAERGLDLPDVMRMMLTKAVRIGDFAIDQDPLAAAPPVPEPTPGPYVLRYWGEAKAMLDAEAALAVLHRAIADRTAALDEGLAARAPDPVQIERLRNERDQASALLAAFDPKDAAAVATVLERFGSVPPSGASDTAA